MDHQASVRETACGETELDVVVYELEETIDLERVGLSILEIEWGGNDELGIGLVDGPAAEALLLGERDCLPEGTVRKGMPRKPLHELPDGRLVSPKEEVEKEEEPRKIPRAFKGRVMEVDKYHELV